MQRLSGYQAKAMGLSQFLRHPILGEHKAEKLPGTSVCGKGAPGRPGTAERPPQGRSADTSELSASWAGVTASGVPRASLQLMPEKQLLKLLQQSSPAREHEFAQRRPRVWDFLQAQGFIFRFHVKFVFSFIKQLNIVLKTSERLSWSCALPAPQPPWDT